MHDTGELRNEEDAGGHHEIPLTGPQGGDDRQGQEDPWKPIKMSMKRIMSWSAHRPT